MTSKNSFPLTLIKRADIINFPDPNIVYKSPACGLCNQLFWLLNTIIRGAMIDKQYVIIDYFFCCIYQGNMCPINKIIDLEATTKLINNIDICRHIKLLDRSKIDMKIINAHYGLKNVKTIDVTSQLKKYHDIHNKLPLMTNMNRFFNNDPCVGIKKKLYITYTLNNYICEDEIAENSEDYKIAINLEYMTRHIFNTEGNSKFFWYNALNETLFSALFDKIIFTDGFHEIVNVISQKYDIATTNFIHFRIESDAINHYSVVNKLDRNTFKKKLYDKYNYLLEKYIDKNDTNYILSHDENDIINNFPDYNFLYTDRVIKDQLIMKYYNIYGRELSAVVDLLLGISCTKIFIGCFNFKYSRGSTFSYMIATHAKCKKILFDLDDINSEEIVHDK